MASDKYEFRITAADDSKKGWDSAVRTAQTAQGQMSVAGAPSGVKLSGAPGSTIAATQDKQVVKNLENINNTLDEINKNVKSGITSARRGGGAGASGVEVPGQKAGKGGLFGKLAGAGAMIGGAGAIFSMISSIGGIISSRASNRQSIQTQQKTASQLGIMGPGRSYWLGEHKEGFGPDQQLSFMAAYGRQAISGKRKAHQLDYQKFENLSSKAHKFSVATGVEMGDIGEITGKVERFRSERPSSSGEFDTRFQGSQLTDYMAGLAKQGNMGGGRFQEFFKGIQEAVDTGISSGADTSMKDIIKGASGYFNTSNERLKALAPQRQQTHQQLKTSAANLEGGSMMLMKAVWEELGQDKSVLDVQQKVSNMNAHDAFRTTADYVTSKTGKGKEGLERARRILRKEGFLVSGGIKQQYEEILGKEETKSGKNRSPNETIKEGRAVVKERLEEVGMINLAANVKQASDGVRDLGANSRGAAKLVNFFSKTMATLDKKMGQMQFGKATTDEDKGEK